MVILHLSYLQCFRVIYEQGGPSGSASVSRTRVIINSVPLGASTEVTEEITQERTFKGKA